MTYLALGWMAENSDDSEEGAETDAADPVAIDEAAPVEAPLENHASAQPTTPEGASRPFSLIFSDAISDFRQLPADAPEWGENVSEFLAQVTQLQREKLQEAERARNDEFEQLKADISDHLLTGHARLLEFFEWDGHERLTGQTQPWADMQAARKALDGIVGLLAEYEPLHEQASTYREESDRAARRTEIGNRIVDALNALDTLEILPETDMLDDSVDVEHVEPGDAGNRDEQAHSQEDVKAFREQIESLNEEVGQLTTQIGALNQTVRELEADKIDIAEEAKQATDDAKAWRQAYTEASKADSQVDTETQQFATVGEVLEAVQDELDDSLVLALNSSSDRSIRFTNPNDVWSAFEWLATTYTQSKTGEQQVPDLDGSLFRASGFRYIPHQSEATMGTYPSDYKATWGGETYSLANHMGFGRGRGEAAIRIAFAWDAESKMVIVGYIGRHQRTNAS